MVRLFIFNFIALQWLCVFFYKSINRQTFARQIVEHLFYVTLLFHYLIKLYFTRSMVPKLYHYLYSIEIGTDVVIMRFREVISSSQPKNVITVHLRAKQAYNSCRCTTVLHNEIWFIFMDSQLQIMEAKTAKIGDLIISDLEHH